MAAIQTERPIEVKSPLGPDALLIRSFTGTEQLGRLFEYRLELIATDEAIDLSQVLGKDMTVRIVLQDGSDRFFHGIVSRFSQTGRQGGYAVYEATLRPWLWLLTRVADCRIFQEMTVPEIVKKVFRDRGFSDFDENLSRKYRPWEYCVQYRETDFNFVSRLLEQEGIYFSFKHEDGKHTLFLADHYGAHEPFPGYEEVPYYPPTTNVVREGDHVRDWFLTREIQPGKYTITDFDFEQPSSNLLVDTQISRDHPQSEFEIYDYPGEYVVPDDGKQYVKTRIEELHSNWEIVRGEGPVRGMTAGGLFKLVEHPREDQNREYLVLSVSHDAHAPEYGSGGAAASGGAFYSCSFTAMESKTPFRPARITAKPVVQGPQTAIVTGKDGEEIWTDEYGRVKVQFHWDREGKRDENTTCWIRVAQLWAGTNWGGIHIPRIGQEVIVEFLEGDPDRPIVTGRVYNAEQMPPYGLPDNQTQSGIKSRSTKGGADANFNEIRMEDKKGEEELYIHAEKNHTNITENDRSEDVGHDRSLHVGHDKSEAIDNNKSITVGVDHSESIGANKTLSVGANHDETIGANKTLSVGANHSETIGSNMTITVGSNLTETVAINYAETVGAAMELTVGAALAVTVGAVMTESVGLNQSIDVGNKRSMSVGSDNEEKVGGAMKVSVGKDLTETVGGAHKESVTKELEVTAKAVKITAQDEIVLVTGSSKLTMKKDGTIKLEGMKISVEGTQKIEKKAMEIKSEAQMKNEVKGAMVTVEASGINTIKGGLVKIN